MVGNPIDCNCDMNWFSKWINSTTTPSGIRLVKDFRDVTCFGGERDGVPVYKLHEEMMGCLPLPGLVQLRSV